MAERKPIDMAAKDLATWVGAMAGVWVNNPEQLHIVRTAISLAQLELCAMRMWYWALSTGKFIYSSGQSTVNFYSASAGKYSAFAGLTHIRVGTQYPLSETDANNVNRLQIGISTADRPAMYWRLGDSKIAFWPIPTVVDSVHFGFMRVPGFVYSDADVIVPKRFQLNVLGQLAKQKVWEIKGDPRFGQPNPTFDAGLNAMVMDAAGRNADAVRLRKWDPTAGDCRGDRVPVYSGFYSSGNLP